MTAMRVVIEHERGGNDLVHAYGALDEIEPALVDPVSTEGTILPYLATHATVDSATVASFGPDLKCGRAAGEVLLHDHGRVTQLCHRPR